MNILTIYTGFNGALLVASAEIEQKLMWGSARDPHAGALKAVCLETGLFLKAMKVVDKTTWPVGFKLILQIELSQRDE